MDTANNDNLLLKASNLFISSQIVSSALLQRRLKIDETQADELMHRLEQACVINPTHDSLTEEYKIKPTEHNDSSMIKEIRQWKKEQNSWKNKIKKLLRIYWWLWLALFVVALVIIIIGPSIVGNFTFRFFSALFKIICVGATFYYIVEYTLGKGIIGIWGFLRLAGLIGFICFSCFIYVAAEGYNIKDLLWDNQLTGVKHNLLIFLALDIISLLFIPLGELLLYLHKINDKMSSFPSLKSNQ